MIKTTSERKSGFTLFGKSWYDSDTVRALTVYCWWLCISSKIYPKVKKFTKRLSISVPRCCIRSGQVGIRIDLSPCSSCSQICTAPAVVKTHYFVCLTHLSPSQCEHLSSWAVLTTAPQLCWYPGRSSWSCQACRLPCPTVGLSPRRSASSLLMLTFRTRLALATGPDSSLATLQSLRCLYR